MELEQKIRKVLETRRGSWMTIGTVENLTEELVVVCTVPEKTYYSVSEAAKQLGVFSLTLRNWEKKNYIKSYRTPGGHRRFTPAEIQRVMTVRPSNG